MFEVGDKVIFYKDDYTDITYRTVDEMLEIMESGTVLEVVSTSLGYHVLCSSTEKQYNYSHSYDSRDLKLASRVIRSL